MAKYQRVSTRELDILESLREAFTWGASIRQACAHASISSETYHRLTKDNQELKKEFKDRQRTRVLYALKTTHDAIKRGELKTATWELERRDKRFSAKSEQKIKQVSPLDEIPKETRDKMLLDLAKDIAKDKK